MMKSLFNKKDNDDLVERLAALRHDTPAQWGTMNVGQMLAHCQDPLRMAFGEVKIKRSFISYIFGRMLRKNLTRNDKPFGKNLPTADEFKHTDQREFEKEKTELMSLIRKFAEAGPDNLSKDPHPFFGKMTPREWDVLQWKHLDHHFRQFGA